jgi:hypothetical protein
MRMLKLTHKFVLTISAAFAIFFAVSLAPTRAEAMPLNMSTAIGADVDSSSSLTKVWCCHRGGWHRGGWHGGWRGRGWGWRRRGWGGPGCGFAFHRVCGPYRCWCAPN